MHFTPTDWLTLALVVITGLYAWATFRILRANEAVVSAMKEQTEAQLRPYIVVSASPRVGTTLMCMNIENIGRSPAENLRMQMDRDFYPHGEHRENENIAKLPVFAEPIRSLAPGARVTFILGAGHTIFSALEELCPRHFIVHAKYLSGKRSYAEDNSVDMRHLMHSSVVNDPIAEEIEKLRKVIEEYVKRQRDA